MDYFINKLTKNDLINYINKNKLDVDINDIDTVYYYIKNYYKDFFNDKEIILEKIKKDLKPNTYSTVLNLINKYKSFLN